MMKTGLFAGLDVSTQSCKLVVIDLASESVVFVDTVQYDTDLPEYHTKNGVVQGLGEGVSESDPRMWIDAVEMVFSRFKKTGLPAGEIRSISVSGQQHGLVSIDETGNLTRPRSKLWNDFSTLEECRILTEKTGGLDSMLREVGNSQRTGYTAPKIFHMFRHEKNMYDRTAVFFLVHNYINWILTGGKRGGIRVMEPGDTSGTALWNPKTGIWSQKVIEAINPGLKAKLPPVRPSDESIGSVSHDWVDQFGFSPACKIDAGSGDNMYGAIGTGNVKPGIVTVSLGTSGTAYSYMEQAFVDPTGEIAAFCDSTGHYLPLLCVSNLANGYNEIVDQYKLSHKEFDRIVQKTPPGNKGRLLIPWYMGERTPDLPLASPIYFGFGLRDFTLEILARAVLEGHILNLYDGFSRMPVEPKEIRLTGGLSRSEVWCQTISDVFESEVVPIEGEGAALGAAIHAAWVWLKEARQAVPLEELTSLFVVLDEKQRKKPVPGSVKVHQIQKKLFRRLSEGIRTGKNNDLFVLRNILAS